MKSIKSYIATFLGMLAITFIGSIAISICIGNYLVFAQVPPVATVAKLEFDNNGSNFTYQYKVQKCPSGSVLVQNDYGDWMTRGCQEEIFTEAGTQSIWVGTFEEINKTGLIVEETVYSDNGVRVSLKKSIYPKPNAPGKIDINATKPTLTTKTEFKNNLPISETEYYNDGSKSVTFMDADERVTKIENYDSKGNLINKEIVSSISTKYSLKEPSKIACEVTDLPTKNIKKFTVELKDGKTTGQTSQEGLTVAAGVTVAKFNCYSSSFKKTLLALDESISVQKLTAELNELNAEIAKLSEKRGNFSGSIYFRVYDGLIKETQSKASAKQNEIASIQKRAN